MTKDICHDCGEKKRLGTHWVMSSCSYPEISGYQIELLTGMLMGDATFRFKPKARNPYIVVGMINKPFLEWLDNKLGDLTSGVYLKDEAGEYSGTMFDGNMIESKHDCYGLRTRSHPQLKKFEEWYESGNKVFPTDITLASELAKMWYVCDGGLNWGPYGSNIRIWSSNEEDNGDKIMKMFSDVGFDVSQHRDSYSLSREQTEEFLEWMGKPPTGFEYKWENNNREEYDQLKKTIYINGDN